MGGGWAHETSFSDFLLATRRAPTTARSYVAYARLYRDWCYARETDPVTAPTAAVSAYVAYMLGRLAHNSVPLRLAALRAFYAYCRASGLRCDDPTEGLSVGWQRLEPRAPLQDADLAQLLDGCRNQRDRAMITVAVSCGLRVGELAAMRAEHVNLDKGVLLVKGKGGVERWLALPDQARMALQLPCSRAVGGRGDSWRGSPGLQNLF
jgi:integrase/recombinase XerD